MIDPPNSNGEVYLNGDIIESFPKIDVHDYGTNISVSATSNSAWEFDYWTSFKNNGMIYPITVSPHTEDWVQERLQRGKTPQHLKANGDVRPGLYVQTGHKRVYWARERGFTHIEGYYVTDREDKAKIRSKLHIPHTEIPR